MIGFPPTSSVIDFQQIIGAEALLRVSFPDSYRTLLSKFNGSYGAAEFSLSGNKGSAEIGVWLSISPWDSESMCSTLSTWKQHKLSTRIVPFGEDGGGNYVCFDYRRSDTPSIVFWFHELEGEDGLYPVAPSFEEFLNDLRSIDEKL